MSRVPDPRTVFRIARWEVGRSAGTVDRRTIAVVGVGVLVAVALAPTITAGGASTDGEIYRVGVAADDPYHAVVESDPQFAVRPPSREALSEGRIEVLVSDGELSYRDTAKGRAALASFRDSIRDYNDRRMRRSVEDGDDPAAAFPVYVSILYESRTSTRSAGGGGGSVGGGGTGASGGDGDGGDGDASEAESSGDRLQVPRIGGSGGGEGSPSSISPPFPFGSLVLAFLFIVPMNFVVQSYGSTIMNERINRRGELMLVSPVSRGDIVAGKTLPYFAVLAGITLAVAGLIGGGVQSVAAVLPVALVFLGATFVGAMFARSFKELTFVTLTISVFLTAYTFVPAIFSDVTPIALISPLTLVVRDLQGTGATAGEYLFSTGPFYLCGLVLFLLGTGVYREEDMFTQRPVHLKALDAFAARMAGRKSAVLWSGLLVPFAFVAQLLAVALLFALPVELSLPLMLVVVAVIEELVKSVHVYAGFVHARYDRSITTAVVVGAFSGLGFFVGEKFTHVAQVVGLPDLPLGEAVVLPIEGPTVVIAGALLLAPLALHAVTATISALGARRNRTAYAVAVAVAVAVHVAYNVAIIEVVAGGL